MTHAGPKQFLTKVADEVKKETKRDSKEDAERKLARMISPDQYIGDLITLDYGHADILVHDTQRHRANGIPHGCLLLATRITPVDLYNNAFPSDPSLLLIRVSESARLRSDADLETARLDAVKRANDTESDLRRVRADRPVHPEHAPVLRHQMPDPGHVSGLSARTRRVDSPLRK